jgi:translation initiation factor IF-3
MFHKRPFFRKFNRPFRVFRKQSREKVNEQIKAAEVRVIDDKGQNLGILKTDEAMRTAKEKGLDLVEITENVQPPVCKIIEYGKYRYAQEKKEKKQHAHQKTGEIKGIRIGFATSPHDLEIRTRQIEKFFKQGYKVRIEMKLRGREKAHQDLAREKLESFIKMTSGAIKEDNIQKSPQGFTVIVCQGKQENQ